MTVYGEPATLRPARSKVAENAPPLPIVAGTVLLSRVMATVWPVEAPEMSPEKVTLGLPKVAVGSLRPEKLTELAEPTFVKLNAIAAPAIDAVTV